MVFQKYEIVPKPLRVTRSDSVSQHINTLVRQRAMTGQPTNPLLIQVESRYEGCKGKKGRLH